MKWGILATGTIAKKFAATVCQMDPSEAVLTAVGSRTSESARAFAEAYGIPRYYGSYEDLAKDPEVEATYISTPNHMHYENCMMCLEAGKHVLCEKPFTTNAAEARTLYHMAEEKGLFIMEAFWIRFLPLYDKLRELLDQGIIGDVRHARCEFGFVASGARKDRKFDSSLGGGALLDIGIYNLGFLHMIMGAAPESFTSQVHINEYGTDDFSVLQLSYPKGRTGHALQTIGMETGREAAIFGTKGSVHLKDYQQAQTMTIQTLDGESQEFSMPFEINGFEYQIRETARCIKAGMSASDRFSPEDSLAVLQLMDDIRQSWDMKFTYEA